MNPNTGGRVTFEIGSEVRILCSDARISSEVYIITTTKSDRKGHVTLKEKDTDRQIKVHFRRIFPVDKNEHAVVIESNGKYRSVCPKCNYVGTINATNSNTEFLDCPSCGKFNLIWLVEKPMENIVAETTQESVETIEKPKTPRERAPKVVKEPVTVDLNAIAAMDNCELWTKSNVSFDHERITVKSHTLLYVGENPRKFCFNTYNGTLGKESNNLPITEFVQDTVVAGAKKEKPWYSVKDVEKARAKFLRDGYELHTK